MNQGFHITHHFTDMSISGEQNLNKYKAHSKSIQRNSVKDSCIRKGLYAKAKTLGEPGHVPPQLLRNAYGFISYSHLSPQYL